MSIGLRNNKRYGIFKADSNEGIVKVKIYICGWGEIIEVYKDKKLIASADTSNGEDEADYDENETSLNVEGIEIVKPFIRCLKRFK